MADPSIIIPNTEQVGSQPQQDQGGFFSRLGAGLRKVMPYVTPIANRLAAAAGNYGPIELEHQQREQQMEQARLGLQQQLNDSQLQNQELNRQLLTKQIGNIRTPDEQAAAALKLKGQEEAIAQPKDIVAPMEGGGMGHYNQSFNPETNQWGTKPTMVQGPAVPNPTQAPNAGMAPPTMPSLFPPSKTVTPAPQQLPAMSKPVSSAGDVEPDGNSPTGFSRVWRGPDLRELGRQPAPAPNAYVPSDTSGTNTTLKQDINGNWVSMQEPHSSTKTPTLPLGSNGNPPSTKPKVPPSSSQAKPVTDASGNPVHGPLSGDARKNISQIVTTQKLIDSVLPELDQRVAQIKQSGGDANSLWDSVSQRAAWLEYQKGGIVPSNIDPALAHLLPTIAQLQIVGGLPYLRGTRAFQYIQQIQQHLPNPEKDSPALMVDKIHSLQKTMPILRQAVIEAETNPTGSNTPPTMPSTAPKMGDVKKFPNGNTGVWDGTGWVQQSTPTQQPH